MKQHRTESEPRHLRHRLDKLPQWDVSPGLLATRLAGRLVVPAGRAARWSRANVRHPAPAQARTARPFVLDRLPGPSRAGHGRWRGGDAPSARAASLASSAALPGYRTRASPGPTPGRRPLRQSLRQSLRHSLRRRWRTPSPAGGQDRRRSCPLGGVERPRRAVRFARLIHRRVRAFWRTCGPRRLRRRSDPDVVATQGGTA